MKRLNVIKRVAKFLKSIQHWQVGQGRGCDSQRVPRLWEVNDCHQCCQPCHCSPRRTDCVRMQFIRWTQLDCYARRTSLESLYLPSTCNTVISTLFTCNYLRHCICVYTILPRSRSNQFIHLYIFNDTIIASTRRNE